MLKKIRNSSKFNSFENQQFLNILECTLDKKGGNEVIDSLSRGGLKTVTSDTLRIFYLAEEEFRKTTEISNLRKINAEEIAQTLLENHDIVSIFKTVTDDVTDVTDETRENVLNKILPLYLRVRSYSLARDLTSKQKKESKDAKIKKGFRKQIKKAMEQPDSNLPI